MWLTMASLQSRLLNHDSSRFSLLTIAFLTSIIWATLVRKIAVGNSASEIFAYAMGSSLGVLSAREAHIWFTNSKSNGRVSNERV